MLIRILIPFWGMPYVGVNNGETWMIAGHNSKTTLEGEDSYNSFTCLMLQLQKMELLA